MTHRRETLCPGTRISCPSCGGVVPFADIRNGDGFFRCQRKVGQGSNRQTCGTHFYVLCTARLCSVWELTQEERHRFDSGHYTPDEILAEVGVRVREAA